MRLLAQIRKIDYQLLLLALALQFTLWCPLAFAVSSVLMWLHVSIGAWHVYLITFSTTALNLIFLKRYSGKWQLNFGLISMLVYVLFLGLCLPHFNQVFDNSYDGIWYHQEALLNFKNGWNPFVRPLRADEGSLWGPFYMNHYPKATWMAQAVLYSFTNQLESVKITQLMLMLGLIFLTAFTLLQFSGIPFLVVPIIAVLVGFNPVSIYQLYSFYVDSHLGLALMGLMLFLVLQLYTRNAIFLWPALLLFVYVSNIKFTGLVYATFLLGLYFVYCVWKKQPQLWRLIIVLFASGIFAVGVFGYPTYIRNIITNQHPFYPIMGPESFGDGIAKIVQSADMEGKNRFEKFWIGTFARPQWSRAPENSVPKKLFKPIPDPYYYTRSDVEMGSFGPYYAEVFISLLVGLLLLVVFKFNQKQHVMLLLLAITLSAFINAEVWYARYTPHLWLAVLTIVAALFFIPKLKWLGYLLLIGLLFNNGLLLKYYASVRIIESKLATEQINQLKKLNKPVSIALGWQITFPIKAKEYGLPCVFKSVNEINKQEYSSFSGYQQGEWAMFNQAEMKAAQSMP
jgi:hypothetical protein